MGSEVVGVVIVVLALAALYVWMALALGELFRKLGEETLPAWVPGWNLAVLLQVGGYSPWLVLVPGVGLVFVVAACHRIGAGFGYGAAMTVVATIWFPIWVSVLAWGPAAWSGSSRVRPFTSPVTARSQPQHAVPSQVWATGGSAPNPPMAPAPVASPVWTAVVNPVVARPVVADPVPSNVTQQFPLSVGSWAPASQRVTPDPMGEVGMTQIKPLFVDDATPGGPTPAPKSVPADKDLTPFGAASKERVLIEPMPIEPMLIEPMPIEPMLIEPPTTAAPAPKPSLMVGTAADLVASAFDRIVPPPMPASQAAPKPEVAAPKPEVAASKPEVAAPKPEAGSPMAAEAAPVVVATPTPKSSLDDDSDRTMLAARFRPVWSVADAEGGKVELTGSEVVLGRNPGPLPEAAAAQLVTLADPTRTVSKAHALLQLVQGVWFIQDLGSTNGVILVDADGTERLLAADFTEPLTERFFLGDAEFRLKSEIDPGRLR